VYFSELPALYEKLRQWGFPHVVDGDEISSAYSPLWDVFSFHPVFASFYAARNAILKDRPNKVFLGVKSYFTGPPDIVMAGKLIIGAYSAIAKNLACQNRFSGHRPDLFMSTPYPFANFGTASEYREKHALPDGDIIIGNDVWIGRNVILLSGVRVGDGAVIGAGSVVTRDVAPYSVTAGHPARHVRWRFPEAVRESLLDIRWWDWPLLELRQIGPLLRSDRIEELLRYAERRGRDFAK
jgi:acetyltransferase-like isoleucine patch superfamily enzyme